MIKIIFLLIDLSAIVTSFLLAKFLRFHTGTHLIQNQGTTLIFLILLILLVKYLYDLYNHCYYAQIGRVFFKVINVWAISFVVYVLIGFLTKFYFLINSRGFIFYFFVIYPIVISFLRIIIMPQILIGYFSKPEKRKICYYFGSEENFSIFHKFFEDNPVVGLTLLKPVANSCQVEYPEVFLYSTENNFGEFYRKIQEISRPGQKVHITSPLFNELPLNWEWCKINNLPIVSLQVNGQKQWQNTVRRILDVILSSLILIILVPVFAIIAIAIKIDSPGPIIYKQKRCGKDGKEFTLYKFRSMYNNNSQTKREIEFKEFIEKKTAKGKVINNADVTSVGKVLRRASIDEFPQFLNVLKGDMTLIGPRPPIPYEVKYYKDWHKDRLKIKPGISGLWQVYGRGSMPCDSSIFLDLLYTLNHSLTLDIKLLFQTIPAVLLGKGAY
ncbi:MAG: exopolysaccharide biosynthesis polyprenyl glycosylphosphotransferase [bacterium]